MYIQIIQVPYDTGHRGERMGRGPEYFVQQKLDETLRAQGWDVEVEAIEAQRPFRAEVFTAFELARFLAERVRAAREKGALPLVLAGNCNSCLGTIAGSDPQSLGIIWFDCHGDLNTPETTESGFLDGMGLAVAMGRCWTKVAKTILGFTPIPDNRVLMIGMRQLDPGEIDLLEHSNITLIKGDHIRQEGLQASLVEPLTAFRSKVPRIYLHIDLDALDPQVGTANEYAEPNGLLVEEMKDALSMICQQFEIAAVAFTAYDPSFDPDHRIFQATVQIMQHLLKGIERSPAG